MKKGLFIGGLAALVLALAPGCGNDVNSGNRDKDVTADMRAYDGFNGNDLRDGDVQVKHDLSGLDSSEDQPDLSQIDFSGGKKDPPTIKLVNGPNDTPYVDRYVKGDATYKADVFSPYGGNLSCRFTFSDGHDTGFGNCTISHGLPDIGDYTLDAKVKDDTTGLTASTKADLHNVRINNNLPPVLILNCHEIDPQDGMCVYKGKVDELITWDASNSYDDDGNIVKYGFIPEEGGLTSSGTELPYIATISYANPGVYNGKFWVIDNGSAKTERLFRAIIQ